MALTESKTKDKKVKIFSQMRETENFEPVIINHGRIQRRNGTRRLRPYVAPLNLTGCDSWDNSPVRQVA